MDEFQNKRNGIHCICNLFLHNKINFAYTKTVQKLFHLITNLGGRINGDVRK